MTSLRAGTMSLVLIAASITAVWGADSLALRARLLSDFGALKERPLFAPDRSAPVPFNPPEPEPVYVEPEPAPEAPAAMGPPDWQLVGVVRSENLNSATFTSPGAVAAFSLREGESRDGWTLAEVGRFEVTLDGGGERISLRFPDTPSPDSMMPEVGLEGAIGPDGMPLGADPGIHPGEIVGQPGVDMTQPDGVTPEAAPADQLQ